MLTFMFDSIKQREKDNIKAHWLLIHGMKFPRIDGRQPEFFYPKIIRHQTERISCAFHFAVSFSGFPFIVVFGQQAVTKLSKGETL